jgi:outer membrane protein, heavy metal efflux system
MRTFITTVSVLVCAASAAQAQTIPLDTLIEEALSRNPQVAAAERRYAAALQRPAQERTLPDPMIGIGYSSVGNPLPGAGLGTEPTANIGVEVTQQIPYPGKLELRAAVASKEADAQRQQIDAVRSSIAARVKQAYFSLASTYAVEDVLQRNATLLDMLLAVTEGRYETGGAAQSDVFKAQTELTLIELRREENLRDRAQREAELTALLARAPGTPLGRPEPLPAPPAAFDTSLDVLLAHARAHAPVLAPQRAMVERGELAVSAARRDFKPDFSVTGGYFNQGSMPPMYSLRFDVTVPLQKARRAAAVAEQTELLSAARQEYDVTRLDIDARVQQEYRTATTALRLATLYDATVLPQARLALESSLAAYQTGATEFLGLLTNVASILEFEMKYVDELTSFHVATAGLEAMTGMPLVQ